LDPENKRAHFISPHSLGNKLQSANASLLFPLMPHLCVNVTSLAAGFFFFFFFLVRGQKILGVNVFKNELALKYFLKPSHCILKTGHLTVTILNRKIPANFLIPWEA
jgi:hypothetical protein